MVVIDPPFITREVWEKYARTANLLLETDPLCKHDKSTKKTSLIIGTTVLENRQIMSSLFDAQPTIFQPSIPNLVYQYSIFTNFSSKVLSNKNNEIFV